MQGLVEVQGLEEVQGLVEGQGLEVEPRRMAMWGLKVVQDQMKQEEKVKVVFINPTLI